MKTVINRKWIIIVAVAYTCLFLLFLGKAMFTDSLDYKLDFIAYGGVFKYHYLFWNGGKVSLYWSAHIVGVMGMVMLCLMRGKQFGYTKQFSVVTALLLAVMGYIGAKMLYILENINRVKEKGVSLDGVSFFGTIFFIPVALYLISKMIKTDFGNYLDYCTPAGLIMLICIRTGCFLNGCCQGIYFEYKSRPVIFPSQLLECVLDSILLYVLFAMEDKIKTGHLYVVFMGGYGVLRFFVECTRDTDKVTLGMSNGQIFSIICVMVLLTTVFAQRVKAKTKG